MNQMQMRQRIRLDFEDSLKRRDRPAITVLRSLLSAIDNAEAVEMTETNAQPTLGLGGDVPRKLLSENDVREILEREILERRTAIGTYEKFGEDGRADILRAEVVLIQSYVGHHSK